MSCSVRSMRSPMLLPLFSMERWLKQAAFGEDVVPEVNWMFTISSGWRSDLKNGSDDLPSKRIWLKSVVVRNFDASIRPSELLTIMT